MRTVVIFLNILFASVTINVYGQQIQNSLVRFNHLASDKGLSETTNEFIFKDHFNNVWISSIEGLNRFDGRRVKVFKHDATDSLSLLDDNIQSSFFEDKNRDIWFTTVNGIHCYRRKRGNFDRFYVKTEGSVLDKVEYTAFFLENQRWLWTRAGDSLYKFDTYLSPNDAINSQFLHKLQAARFAVDTFEDGKIRRIFACFWDYKQGFEQIDYNKQAQIVKRQTFFANTVYDKTPVLTIQQALIENDTLVWLSGEKSIIAFNPKKPLSHSVYIPPLEGGVIRYMTLLDNKNLLIATNQTPLLLFDRLKNSFTPYLSNTNKQIYAEEQINPSHLYIDPSNEIWISASKKGIFYTQLKSMPFKNLFAINKHHPLSISQIIEDKEGQVWTISKAPQSSYYLFDKKLMIIKNKELPLGSKFFKNNQEQLGCLSPKKSMQYYNYKNRDFNTIYKNDSLDFRDAISINNQTLILASNKGLHYFDINKSSLNPTPIHDFSLLLHKDAKNHIWQATMDGKIICYENNSNNLTSKLKEYSNLGTVNSFHNSVVTPSVLWAATAKGIIKINTETLIETLFTEKDNLPSNYIQSVLEDKKGNLWCGTNQGIVKYDPISKKSKLYTRRNGLSSDAYNRGAALLSSTGEMWFGGNNGVDVFHPDSIRDIGHAPQSAIVGLKIHDKYWKGETAIEVTEHITLKHNDNTLTLELAAMEYTDPENNQFKVALVAEGDTIQWVNLGTQNYVTYPNLREGRYTFMLLTANTEGIWNQTPKTLVIDIKPPYWRTWWFLCLVALATMALVGYIVYLRLSKVIELQKIRLNLYENLHDDIGSRLTAIVLSVDVLMQKATLKDGQLERISTISRNIVANMRRLVWATAPENDALETVIQQMQTDRRVLLPSGVQFTLTMDKALKTKEIGGDKRYQMLSIFNETLTNIAKYAEATAVETRIEIQEDKLTMTIVDNGKGFDPDAPRENTAMSSGHGLRNMHRRANRIKGNLAITSKIGEGTSVQFSFSMRDEPIWGKFLALFSKSH